MNMISGTTGIMGCADGAMVLVRPNRGEQKAVLSMTGRDIQDARISLVQNLETMCWEFAGYMDEMPEEQLDPVLSSIAILVEQQNPWVGTAEELRAQLQELNPRLDLRANALSRRLNAQAQDLEHQYGILFTKHRGHDSKLIHLEIATDASDGDDISAIE